MVASLTLGASSIIAPQTLLDFSAGIGVTDDGTDYTIGFSIPIRYDLRGLPAIF